MPKPCDTIDTITPLGSRKRLEEARKEFKGFFQSYKEFLENWGAYQKSTPIHTKKLQRAKHAMFKATFRRSERCP
jgi:hypothetical protein